MTRADAAVMMSDPFIRALLRGCKASYRRPVDPQPELCHGCQTCAFRCDHFLGRVNDLVEVGQRLWLKEPWAPAKADPDRAPGTPTLPDNVMAKYRADYSRAELASGRHNTWRGCSPWSSAKTMARCYARFVLKVTAYRVERLHAITDDQARAEGIPDDFGMAGKLGFESELWAGPRINYARIWDHAMEPLGFGWATNPYVHVVEFEIVKGPSVVA